MAQVFFFAFFFEKDPHVNAVEQQVIVPVGFAKHALHKWA